MFGDTYNLRRTIIGDGTVTKFKLIQAFIVAFLSARMKKINSKLKALEGSQQIYHYKSKGIFPDAQGQLVPQSNVRSG